MFRHLYSNSESNSKFLFEIPNANVLPQIAELHKGKELSKDCNFSSRPADAGYTISLTSVVGIFPLHESTVFLRSVTQEKVIFFNRNLFLGVKELLESKALEQAITLP